MSYAEQPWKRRWPENQKPYFAYATVWVWTEIPTKPGMKIFPSIECPETVGHYDIMYLGQDYDGSEVAMVIDGPEIGKTFYLEHSGIATFH